MLNYLRKIIWLEENRLLVNIEYFQRVLDWYQMFVDLFVI